MKKILIAAVILGFCGSAYSEEYKFKASGVSEIDIVIKAGTLNITSAKTKEIVINIQPDKPQDFQRNIWVDNDKELKIYLDDGYITEHSGIDITIPDSMSDIEINSDSADINIAGIRGTLNIDAARGKIKVMDYKGRLDLDVADTETEISGVFRELDIENSKSNVRVFLNSLPAGYEYEVTGAGEISFKLPAKINKDKFQIDRHEFYGTLNISN